MGIINLTPDSFSDGGQLTTVAQAVAHARALVASGASILDLGAESSRPGAEAISIAEENLRLMPVLDALIAAKLPAAISVDTRQSDIAQEALERGADLINDITGRLQPEMIEAVARHDASYVLMHNRGDFSSMHDDYVYGDVVSEVRSELQQRRDELTGAGLVAEQIWLDVGFGFAKNVEQCWALFSALRQFTNLQTPLLLGISRKRFVRAAMLASDDSEMFARTDRATAALCALGAQAGAQMMRVHNVTACCEAIAVGARARLA